MLKDLFDIGVNQTEPSHDWEEVQEYNLLMTIRESSMEPSASLKPCHARDDQALDKQCELLLVFR